MRYNTSMGSMNRPFTILFVLVALTIIAALATRAKAEQTAEPFSSRVANFQEEIPLLEASFERAKEAFLSIEDPFNTIANPILEPEESKTVIEDNNTTTTIEHQSDEANGTTTTVIESTTDFSQGDTTNVQSDPPKVDIKSDENATVTQENGTTTIKSEGLEVKFNNNGDDPTADSENSINTNTRIRTRQKTDIREQSDIDASIKINE